MSQPSSYLEADLTPTPLKSGTDLSDFQAAHRNLAVETPDIKEERKSIPNKLIQSRAQQVGNQNASNKKQGNKQGDKQPYQYIEFPQKAELCFSKMKHLLLSQQGVDCYSISMKKAPPKTVKIEVSAPKHSNLFEISPQKLLFNDKNYSVPQKIAITFKFKAIEDLMLKIISVPTEPVQIHHQMKCRDADFDRKLIITKLYVYNSVHSQIYAMGSDDKCELGLDSSKYRYSAAKFARSVELQDFIQVNVNSPESVTFVQPRDPETAQSFTDISVGQSHSIALTSTGKVYTWGLGLLGQLGQNESEIKLIQDAIQLKSIKKARASMEKNKDITYEYNQYKPGGKYPTLFRKQFTPLLPSPYHLDRFNGKYVSKIACGKFHSMFLINTGSLFACGCALNGRLGLGQIMQNVVPRPEVVNCSGQKIVNVSCGDDYSAIASIRGEVFTTGAGRSGIHCLSKQEYAEDQLNFQRIKKLQNILLISCGANHMAAISKIGQLYCWGSAQDGRLGTEKLNSLQQLDQQVKQFIPSPIKTSIQSPNFRTSLNLKSSTEQSIRQKHACVVITSQPIQIPSPDNSGWTLVSCGGRHTLGRSGNGKIYAWGNNKFGQLGLSSSQFESQNTPQELMIFESKAVVTLSAGVYHSSAATVQGLLYTWGSNTRGQLGLVTKTQGKTVNVKVGIPHIIPQLIGKQGTKIVSSSDKTVVLTSPEDSQNTQNKELFTQWKTKLLEHQRNLSLMIDSQYRVMKRQQKNLGQIKRRQMERKKLAQQVKKKKKQNSAKPAKQQQSSSPPKINMMSNTLTFGGAGIKNTSSQQSFGKHKKTSNQAYEKVQIFQDRSIHSFKKSNGHTTYVTMYPLRGKSKSSGIKKKLIKGPMPASKFFSKQNKELVNKVKQIDEDAQFNPYVFMTSYKLNHQFPVAKIGDYKTHIIEKEFSLFNARYVYPYETTPNPFRLDKC